MSCVYRIGFVYVVMLYILPEDSYFILKNVHLANITYDIHIKRTDSYTPSFINKQRSLYYCCCMLEKGMIFFTQEYLASIQHIFYVCAFVNKVHCLYCCYSSIDEVSICNKKQYNIYINCNKIKKK